jgi:hypothetical protein
MMSLIVEVGRYTGVASDVEAVAAGAAEFAAAGSEDLHPPIRKNKTVGRRIKRCFRIMVPFLNKDERVAL